MNMKKVTGFLSNIARNLVPTKLALSAVLLTFAFAACGGDEEAREDVPTATAAGETPAAILTSTDAPVGISAATAPTTTPGAELPRASQASLDDYIGAVCGGQAQVNSWEEGDSLRELSDGLGFVIEGLGALEPPAEVAEWHDATITFAGAFKDAIDDYIQDPGDLTENQFLLRAAFGLVSRFEPVEQAIATMDPDVRNRMVEAGCIDEEALKSQDEETSELIPQLEREEIPVGGSVSGALAASEIIYYQFQAEEGQKYLVAVSWEGIMRVRLLIKDLPDPRVDSISQSNASDSPLIRPWTAPETGTFHIDLYALDGTGTFNVSIAIDGSPDSPSGVSAAWEGSTVEISWDPVDGAEYYVVYHDDRDFGCELDDENRPRFCDELAADVAQTNYVHASPEPPDSLRFRGNHYWVVACNSEGCSGIDANEPVSP